MSACVRACMLIFAMQSVRDRRVEAVYIRDQVLFFVERERERERERAREGERERERDFTLHSASASLLFCIVLPSWMNELNDHMFG